MHILLLQGSFLKIILQLGVLRLAYWECAFFNGRICLLIQLKWQILKHLILLYSNPEYLLRPHLAVLVCPFYLLNQSSTFILMGCLPSRILSTEAVTSLRHQDWWLGGVIPLPTQCHSCVDLIFTQSYTQEGVSCSQENWRHAHHPLPPSPNHTHSFSGTFW